MRRFLMPMLAMCALLLSLPLVAQTPAPTPAAPWWAAIVAPVALLLVSYASKFLFDGLKQLLPVLDSQSSIVKLVLSTVITGAFGFIAAHLALGFTLPGDVHDVTQDTIAGILNALVAAGIYRLEHNKMAAAQAQPTAEQKVDGVTAAHLARPARHNG